MVSETTLTHGIQATDERAVSGVSIMCNLSKGVWEKGVTDGLLSSIQNLMESMKLTAEQVMDALKIPESDRQKYAELLEK